MSTIYYKDYNSPLGDLLIGSFQEKLCLCDWRYRINRTQIDTRLCKNLQANYLNKSTYIIELAIIQLKEYFDLKREYFDIDLLFVGSQFQKIIWRELNKIPYAQTSSYREIATKIGKSKAYRAVANANAANALSIFIPCHRIIGHNGNLTGYAGGMKVKKRLLQLENKLYTVKT